MSLTINLPPAIENEARGYEMLEGGRLLSGCSLITSKRSLSAEGRNTELGRSAIP